MSKLLWYLKLYERLIHFETFLFYWVCGNEDAFCEFGLILLFLNKLPFWRQSFLCPMTLQLLQKIYSNNKKRKYKVWKHFIFAFPGILKCIISRIWGLSLKKLWICIWKSNENIILVIIAKKGKTIRHFFEIRLTILCYFDKKS